MCDPYESLARPVDPAVSLLARRWGAAILIELDRGGSRYNELLRSLTGISPRTLSARMSEFRWLGVVRQVKGSSPRPHYELTSKGRELLGVLDSVAAFSFRWHQPAPGVPA
jgi:DNA-binding HxlR family transcriptional regulator